MTQNARQTGGEGERAEKLIYEFILHIVYILYIITVQFLYNFLHYRYFFSDKL